MSILKNLMILQLGDLRRKRKIDQPSNKSSTANKFQKQGHSLCLFDKDEEFKVSVKKSTSDIKSPPIHKIDPYKRIPFEDS